MRYTKFTIISFLLFLYILPAQGEVYDRIIAIVNDTPIIESEVNTKYNRLAALKKFQTKKEAEEKSRLLDKYIEESIISQTADRESIIVSDKKVDDNINKIMKRMNVNSLDIFKKIIEEKEKTPFDEYREEVRKSIMMELVMSIAIGVSPPSTKDAEDFYKKNIKQMGYEINYSQILIKLKDESFEENKRVSQITKDIYDKLGKGALFNDLAKQFSEDSATKAKGGNAGWTVLSTLAKEDLILANNLYKTFLVDNKKLNIIKSERAYLIVKLNEKRPTSFESVQSDILNLLYQQRLAEQFKKWVIQQREDSDIKIYMEKYIKG